MRLILEVLRYVIWITWHSDECTYDNLHIKFLWPTTYCVPHLFLSENSYVSFIESFFHILFYVETFVMVWYYCCPFVRGIHRSPVNSPHKGQWREALMFSLICARINGWVNNREAGDLRRHHAHYDVTIMPSTTRAYKETTVLIWDEIPHSCMITLWHKLFDHRTVLLCLVGSFHYWECELTFCNQPDFKL